MLKRVYIKGLSIFDTAIGRLHLWLEKKGWMKKIPYTVFSKKENEIPVNHPYPVNFNEKDKALFSHYTNYPTFNETVFEFKNVNVAERGIIFKGMNNIGLSFPHVVFRAEFGWLYLLKNYLFRKKTKAEASKTYILLYDFWSSANYYHWLVDSVPRLMAVSELLKDEKYCLLLPANYPKYIKQTLTYFDIKNTLLINKNEYVQAGNLLLPYYAVGSGHIHPQKVFDVKTYFTSRIIGNIGFEKIYVSRSRQKARRVLNEEAILELVKAEGFEVIFFEDYTFEEQVQIGKRARIMISSHGANLTNLMFMPEQSRVLELIRAKAPNYCYWALASVCKLNYYYQLCTVVGNDHLMVDIETFKINLKKLLHE